MKLTMNKVRAFCWAVKLKIVCPTCSFKSLYKAGRSKTNDKD